MKRRIVPVLFWACVFALPGIADPSARGGERPTHRNDYHGFEFNYPDACAIRDRSGRSEKFVFLTLLLKGRPGGVEVQLADSKDFSVAGLCAADGECSVDCEVKGNSKIDAGDFSGRRYQLISVTTCEDAPPKKKPVPPVYVIDIGEGRSLVFSQVFADPRSSFPDEILTALFKTLKRTARTGS